jgi:ankyrin repeat protein
MSDVTKLHEAVRSGDLDGMRVLLEANPSLANSRSEKDTRGTYPLHVAAEFGQADAAQVLLQYGADVSLLDGENDAIALGWAAFFGRPEVVAVLLKGGSQPSQRNKHGLTPRLCGGRDAGQMEAVLQCHRGGMAGGRGRDSLHGGVE